MVSEVASETTGVRQNRGLMATPYLFVLPAVLLLAMFLLYPWAWTLVMSAWKWSPLSFDPAAFVGLRNFAHLLRDGAFWGAALLSLRIMIGSVIGTLTVGFVLAFVLYRLPRGRNFCLAALMLPMMIAPAVVGIMWRTLLHEQWGVVNYMLRVFSLPPQPWMSSPDHTLWVLLSMEVWSHTPFVMLMFLAGLQAIPQDLFEASTIDGAGKLQTLSHIIAPWLLPLILLAVLFRIMTSLRVFDIVYAFYSSSGPANSGATLGVFLYERLRATWAMGETSAISIVMLLLTLLISLALLRQLQLRAER